MPFARREIDRDTYQKMVALAEELECEPMDFYPSPWHEDKFELGFAEYLVSKDIENEGEFIIKRLN